MKKEKIGIITFHNSYNCGSMLQTFALHNVLKNKKIDNEIINFSNEGQRKVYSVYDKRKSYKAFLKNIVIYFYKKRITNNFDRYEDFITKNFKLSKNKFTEMSQLTDTGYSKIISGSDQVFNITIEDGDDAYFLPWVKNATKIAYAPSFGAKDIEKNSENPKKYATYLKNFDFLSTRENNGKKWIKSLAKRDVEVVLDPTLLLNEKDYEVILDKKINLPEEYIFYYSPGYNPQINKLVSKISEKYKLPVIAFNTKNFVTKGMMLSKMKLPDVEDPSVYLALVKNASLVITTSFHGTIFSTIYKRNFWTVKNGAMFGEDDRVMTLMESLDLKDRLVNIEFNEEFDYLKQLDYKNYDKLLKEKQKVSNDFLNECLK